MKDKYYLVAFGLIWCIMAVFVMMHFVSFYNMYGLPFGRLDADNYLHTVWETSTGTEYEVNHLLITTPPVIFSGLLSPELYFTIFIPIVVMLIPVALLVLAMYLTKNIKVSFLSVIIFMLGTFSMFSFWIMALWGQAVATLFLLLGLVFFEKGRVDAKYHIWFAGCVILAMLAHDASPFFSLLFVAIVFLDGKKYSHSLIVGVVAILGSMVFLEKFTGVYPVSVDVVYIFYNAATPLVWVFALIGMFESRKNPTLRCLSWATVIGIVMSSQFILWRPIVSILCFVALYAGVGFYKMLGFVKHGWIKALVCLLFGVLLIIYTYEQYEGFMNMMLWEMVDNSPDQPRGLDFQSFKDMFFKGSEI